MKSSYRRGNFSLKSSDGGQSFSLSSMGSSVAWSTRRCRTSSKPTQNCLAGMLGRMRPLLQSTRSTSSEPGSQRGWREKGEGGGGPLGPLATHHTLTPHIPSPQYLLFPLYYFILHIHTRTHVHTPYIPTMHPPTLPSFPSHPTPPTLPSFPSHPTPPSTSPLTKVSTERLRHPQMLRQAVLHVGYHHRLGVGPKSHDMQSSHACHMTSPLP